MFVSRFRGDVTAGEQIWVYFTQAIRISRIFQVDSLFFVSGINNESERQCYTGPKLEPRGLVANKEEEIRTPCQAMTKIRYFELTVLGL